MFTQYPARDSFGLSTDNPKLNSLSYEASRGGPNDGRMLFKAIEPPQLFDLFIEQACRSNDRARFYLDDLNMNSIVTESDRYGF